MRRFLYHDEKAECVFTGMDAGQEGDPVFKVLMSHLGWVYVRAPTVDGAIAYANTLRGCEPQQAVMVAGRG